MPAQSNLPMPDIPEAADELGDGGFPAAGRAHKGVMVPAGMEREILWRISVFFVVAEGHLFQPDVHGREGDRTIRMTLFHAI